MKLKRLFSFLFILAIAFSSCSAQGRVESEEIENTSSNMRIAVRSDIGTIVYALNDSNAASDLYNQLPLTVEIENYSDNEKIFYPERRLDTANTPLAEGGLGTLAYYAPWADVVLFYDSFSLSGSLYSLGHAVSGSDFISRLSGEVEIVKLE